MYISIGHFSDYLCWRREHIGFRQGRKPSSTDWISSDNKPLIFETQKLKEREDRAMLLIKEREDRAMLLMEYRTTLGLLYVGVGLFSCGRTSAIRWTSAFSFVLLLDSIE